MEEIEITKLFNSMKKIFNCEALELVLYTDPCSRVSLALSNNIEDFLKREIERNKVASTYTNKVKVNMFVVRKIPIEQVEEILIHEITHCLLLPRNTSAHPKVFWDEHYNNCKTWKKRKGEF